MYRQILIDPSQRNFQQIVWRDNPSEPLKHYQLNTVTYGTASACFLSTRCLKQISIDVKDKFPTESEIIENDFYVDDLITGASTVQELQIIRKNISKILSEYGIEIRKFKSNNAVVIADLLSEQKNIDNYIISNDQNIKTLGISYNATLDQFEYDSKLNEQPNTVTKRTILSSIASVFDPLGLLGPLTVQSKIILQKLWIEKLDWDDPVPIHIFKEWIYFTEQLKGVNTLKIPRHVIINNPINIQIHGYADASNVAYGACIYIRSINSNNQVHTQLLCAKSRIAPTKSISLPRLELCGALLLAKLSKKISELLNISSNDIFYYTDSTIVLSWLSSEPSRWKTFVCNRIAKIQHITNVNNWYHISSNNNPADILSRGINPMQFENYSLWWTGPKMLQGELQVEYLKTNHISNFSKIKSNFIEENKKSTVLVTINQDLYNSQSYIFSKFSSFTKVVNVIAYCLRFIKITQTKSKITGRLTSQEREESINALIKFAQTQEFYEEIHNLKNSKPIKRSSRLYSLLPFIDKQGILRVGGRLKNANISFEAKYPKILPYNHPFTNLIIQHEHKRNLHCGFNATLSFIRQRYWPINGRQAVRKLIKKCVQCFKANPSCISPLMGNLPDYRVNPSRPFLNTGIDYAGPFQLKDSKHRNRKFLKSYICLFICMATKAVHLELVTELTTECFLAALRRFISRRGLVDQLFSDNGTYFIGADNELNKIRQIINSSQLENFFAETHIKWKFIPARSPHFGGIWESAIGSVKYHLKRVMNSQSLTYEEFYTLLTQVESVLNSRPLIPLSDSPNDLDALTPSHFIIGSPLNALPEEDLENQPINYLKRFRLVQQMFQSIWKRWIHEYLHTLQQRSKWQRKTDTSKLIGSMVLLHEENISPLQWPLGRITEVHPGTDNVIRVVSVKTKNGILKRALVKVCLLPIDEY